MRERCLRLMVANVRWVCSGSTAPASSMWFEQMIDCPPTWWYLPSQMATSAATHTGKQARAHSASPHQRNSTTMRATHLVVSSFADGHFCRDVIQQIVTRSAPQHQHNSTTMRATHLVVPALADGRLCYHTQQTVITQHRHISAALLQQHRNVDVPNAAALLMLHCCCCSAATAQHLTPHPPGGSAPHRWPPLP